MATYVVLNAHRAIMYAGDDRNTVNDLLQPSPLNPGDRLGEYAERWENGVPVSAWSRWDTYGPEGRTPGWVDVS